VGEFIGVLSARSEEASLVAELKAGSEEAYVWLIHEYQQPIYSLVYRIVNDPADAADTTQEVFLKVVRGIKRFRGASSLKTWVYRIAVREAANQRRWWSRHKRRETPLEPALTNSTDDVHARGWERVMARDDNSPFDAVQQEEQRARVEEELRQVPEPYRTAVILRDLEGLSYEEMAEVMETSLGTVKSRLTRGREALKRSMAAEGPQASSSWASRALVVGPEVEVTP
jgi:RNA polymerase sigma-70 factor (ECF subfamily)